MAAELFVVLVHHPVLDRQGETVTTALTNMDLHDMSRSAKTYGVRAFYVVHPISAQRELAQRIVDHWVDGSGKKRIPSRADALALIRIVSSLDDVYRELSPERGRAGVRMWTTAAQTRGAEVATFANARAERASADLPIALLFGTGWGLADDVLRDANLRLEPLTGASPDGYNHLSVRAACAIALDRLCSAD